MSGESVMTNGRIGGTTQWISKSAGNSNVGDSLQSGSFYPSAAENIGSSEVQSGKFYANNVDTLGSSEQLAQTNNWIPNNSNIGSDPVTQTKWITNDSNVGSSVQSGGFFNDVGGNIGSGAELLESKLTEAGQTIWNAAGNLINGAKQTVFGASYDLNTLLAKGSSVTTDEANWLKSQGYELEAVVGQVPKYLTQYFDAWWEPSGVYSETNIVGYETGVTGYNWKKIAEVNPFAANTKDIMGVTQATTTKQTLDAAQAAGIPVSWVDGKYTINEEGAAYDRDSKRLMDIQDKYAAQNQETVIYGYGNNKITLDNVKDYQFTGDIWDKVSQFGDVLSGVGEDIFEKYVPKKDPLSYLEQYNLGFKGNDAEWNAVRSFTAGIILDAGVGTVSTLLKVPKYLETVASDPFAAINAAPKQIESFVDSSVYMAKTDPARLVGGLVGLEGLGKLDNLSKVSLKLEGEASGIIRTKTVGEAHIPYMSPAEEVNLVLDNPTISGARAVKTASGDTVRAYDPGTHPTYKQPGSEGIPGIFMTVSRESAETYGEYFLNKGTGKGAKGLLDQVKSDLGGKRVQLIENVKTVSYGGLPAELKTNIYDSIKNKGNFEDYKPQLYDIGQNLANKYQEPIAVPSPKRAAGWLEPENEVFLLMPTKETTKITGKKTVGVTESGAIVQKISFGNMESPSGSILSNLVENAKYNTDVIVSKSGVYKTGHIEAAAQDMTRRYGELHGNLLSYPDTYEVSAHGAVHEANVAKNMKAEASRTNTGTPTERIDILAKLHDVYKIGPSETKIPHATSTELAIKKGKFSTPELEALTPKERAKVATDIGQHTKIKPFTLNPKTWVRGAITEAIYQPSQDARLLANADRLDLTRFGKKVDKNKIFKVGDESLIFNENATVGKKKASKIKAADEDSVLSKYMETEKKTYSVPVAKKKVGKTGTVAETSQKDTPRESIYSKDSYGITDKTGYSGNKKVSKYTPESKLNDVERAVTKNSYGKRESVNKISYPDNYNAPVELSLPATGISKYKGDTKKSILDVTGYSKKSSPVNQNVSNYQAEISKYKPNRGKSDQDTSKYVSAPNVPSYPVSVSKYVPTTPSKYPSESKYSLTVPSNYPDTSKYTPTIPNYPPPNRGTGTYTTDTKTDNYPTPTTKKGGTESIHIYNKTDRTEIYPINNPEWKPTNKKKKKDTEVKTSDEKWGKKKKTYRNKFGSIESYNKAMASADKGFAKPSAKGMKLASPASVKSSVNISKITSGSKKRAKTFNW